MFVGEVGGGRSERGRKVGVQPLGVGGARPFS